MLQSDKGMEWRKQKYKQYSCYSRLIMENGKYFQTNKIKQDLIGDRGKRG